LLVGDNKEWLKIYFDNILREDKDKQAIKDFTAEQLVEARIALSSMTKTMYDKRSSFAHKGLNSKGAATVEDYKMAHKILRWIIEKIVFSMMMEGGSHLLAKEPQKALWIGMLSA
jgi:hypothetical protein